MANGRFYSCPAVPETFCIQQVLLALSCYSLLMMGLHLCHITKNLKIGCGFNIVPTWHPLRLAEDYALVDHLTKGRVIFGLARGYHTREVETFGQPLLDQDANREVFEEQVDIMFKAFNQKSFSHKGRHYELPAKVPYRGYDVEEITLVPRPRTLPVETWQPIVSASDRGMRFMAKHGVKGMIGGGSVLKGAADDVVQKWRKIQEEENGIVAPAGTDLMIGTFMHMADSEEQAIEEMRPYYEENLKMFGPLTGMFTYSGEQLRLLSNPATAREAGMPSLEEAIEANGWLVGTPAMVTSKVKAMEKAMPGLEGLVLNFMMSTPEKTICAQLNRFADEVMPAFR